MDPIGALRETFSQELLRVIGFCNDYARCANKFVQTDLEISWRKNIVGVSSQTKSDWKKFRDPESGACRHTSEVCMDVVDAGLSQAQSDTNSLISRRKSVRRPHSSRVAIISGVSFLFFEAC